jgi:glutathione S-transferase
MPELQLYYSPGSCSRASLICIEETGAPYTPMLVSFMLRENRTPEFLALNPKAKLPVLTVDGRPLSETLAIIYWLNSAYPASGLLPHYDDPFDQAKVLSDLAWASSALHALIARFRFPMMFSQVPEAQQSLRDGGAAGLADGFRLIEARLTGRDWWHGAWSAQDAYLYWVWTRAADAGFPCSDYPTFAAHKQRMDERPSTKAVLAAEAAGQLDLNARGGALTV